MEEIYAAAFWLFYADYTVIFPPALAANAKSAVSVRSDKSGTTWSTQWSPAEWKWNVLDAACNALTPLYETLSEELHGATDAEWEHVLETHEEIIAGVARAITSNARNREGDFRDITVSEKFVVAVLEDQRGDSEYNRLVRASITPEILPELEGILF
jgi:hypothetical protein